MAGLTRMPLLALDLLWFSLASGTEEQVGQEVGREGGVSSQHWAGWVPSL